MDTLNDSVREKDVLLKEVHHRVKNNLQVISSLVNLHAGSVEDEKVQGVLKELENKVSSMALVHEVLYASGDFSSLPMDVYISRLAENLSSFAAVTAPVSLDVNAESISLPLDLAIPCALILVELMTNAYKYAFKEDQRGTITIDFRRLDKSLELAVGDNGQGFDTEALSSGMGSTIVRALTEQLKGQLTVASGPRGTRVSVLFSH
jgi:two-component sensor histidine kinase